MAHGRSKTASILFAVEFNRRHRDRGVHSYALDPDNARALWAKSQEITGERF